MNSPTAAAARAGATAAAERAAIIKSDHLTQTHTHRHTHKHAHKQTHMYHSHHRLFWVFWGASFFCTAPLIFFTLISQAWSSGGHATAVAVSFSHLHKAIVLLMTLYSKQVSPGASTLVAHRFWDQPASLVSFKIQNNIFCYWFSKTATTSFE